MSSDLTQVIILGLIAVFVLLRLRSILGRRDGFEPTERPVMTPANSDRQTNLEVIDGGLDRDIADHVDLQSPEGKALVKMKIAEPGFSASEFLDGARQAYELILMAFENDDLDTLRDFLADDVFDSFASVIEDRKDKGLKVEASFSGIRELKLTDASYDGRSKIGEITVSYVGELMSVVKDSKGRIIEGDPNAIKRQKDIWTFARKMGSDDPNWELVETGG